MLTRQHGKTRYINTELCIFHSSGAFPKQNQPHFSNLYFEFYAKYALKIELRIVCKENWAKNKMK